MKPLLFVLFFAFFLAVTPPLYPEISALNRPAIVQLVYLPPSRLKWRRRKHYGKAGIGDQGPGVRG